MFDREETDRLRQWFDVVQDVHPGYLERGDFVLAERIYKRLGLRVPVRIEKGAKNDDR